MCITAPHPCIFLFQSLLEDFYLGAFSSRKVFIDAFRNHGQAMKRDPVLALLVFWCLFIFIFFSCSQSKLAGYLLPIFPALAPLNRGRL